MVTARLDDGSIVRLAPQSRLRVNPTAGTREVWLDGRAFFAVARDERRPFIVRTRAGDALVLGTRFEVVVGNEDLRVAVVEGKVALSSGGETARVTAGEVSNVVEGQTPSVEKVENVHELLDWVGDFMVFESTPLSEVAREIERRYQMRVIIPDSALARRTVSAWFTDQSVESILTVICRAVDAHCSVQGSVASIEP
jgi:transmembrane sensor